MANLHLALDASRWGQDLSVQLSKATLVKVQAWDVSGRLCFERSEFLPSGRVRFPLPALPAGAVIRVEAAGAVRTVR